MGEILVPKVFHRLWVGNKKMPQQFKDFGDSWIKHHPDWELKLWTENNLPDLINQDYLKYCNTESEISDLVRYELLFKFGGIWLDTDFLCLKNIEHLIEDIPLFASTENHKVICGGFIGSTKRNKYIRQVIRKIPRTLKMNQHKTSDLKIGPTFLTKSIPRDAIVVWPKQLFYPFLPGQKKLEEDLPNNKIAYAAHFWHGSWLGK